MEGPTGFEQAEHVVQVGVTSQEGQAAHGDVGHADVGVFVDKDELLDKNLSHNFAPDSPNNNVTATASPFQDR